MKVLLAYKCHPEGAGDPYTSLLPVGLLSLHALLHRAGHDCTLANLSGLGWGKVRELLKKQRPQVLGVSQFTHNRVDSLKLAALAKELDHGCFTVLGGPHATHCWQELLERHPEVDAVVLGEGETTLQELLGARAAGGDLARVAGIAYRAAKGAVKTAPRAAVADLDGLPLPGGSEAALSVGVDYRRQLEFVVTSRGCPASCLFCSSPLFWGRGVRFRSPRSVVDELRRLKERYGLIYFSFRDDTFTSDRARVLEICRLIVEERLHILWNCQSRVSAVDEGMLAAMKRAGCECIQFGVESGSAAMLKALGKRIVPDEVEKAAAAVRRAGINLSVYLITGIEGEGEAELRETVGLIGRIRAHDGQVSPLVYYPGTQLFARAVRGGAVPADLFERPRGEGFMVRSDPFVEKARQSMLQALETAADRASYTRKEFERQRVQLGYCFVTELLQAELLEAEGDEEGAAELYRGIARREPENPWGHVLAGALCAKRGELSRAREAYRKVVKLVPAHLPGWLALGELELEMGDRGAARKCYAKALELDPNDQVAREGVAS